MMIFQSYRSPDESQPPVMTVSREGDVWVITMDTPQGEPIAVSAGKSLSQALKHMADAMRDREESVYQWHIATPQDQNVMHCGVVITGSPVMGGAPGLGICRKCLRLAGSNT